MATTRIEAAGGFYTRAPRFSDAAAAMRMAHPDREVQFVFDQPECLVGQHGPQILLMHHTWIDGEEQLLVTHRDREEFPLFCLHELTYSGDAVTESRYISVAGEHLGELGLAVERMRRVTEDYDA